MTGPPTFVVPPLQIGAARAAQRILHFMERSPLMFPPALTPEQLETLSAYKQQLSNLVVQTVSGLPRRREVRWALH